MVKKKATVKSIANRVKRLEQGRNAELKTRDVIISGTQNTTGTITMITDTAQGNASTQREGLKIQPRSLRYRYSVELDGSTTTTMFRFIIFMDKQQNGTVATTAELLEADTVYAWGEHDTRPRFKILADRRIALTQSGFNRLVSAEGYIRFPKSMRIFYKGTSAAQTDQGKNNIYVYMVSDEATYPPNVNFYTRLRYVDQ